MDWDKFERTPDGERIAYIHRAKDEEDARAMFRRDLPNAELLFLEELKEGKYRVVFCPKEI